MSGTLGEYLLILGAHAFCFFSLYVADSLQRKREVNENRKNKQNTFSQ